MTLAGSVVRLDFALGAACGRSNSAARPELWQMRGLFHLKVKTQGSTLPLPREVRDPGLAGRRHRQRCGQDVFRPSEGTAPSVFVPSYHGPLPDARDTFRRSVQPEEPVAATLSEEVAEVAEAEMIAPLLSTTVVEPDQSGGVQPAVVRRRGGARQRPAFPPTPHDTVR